MLKITGPAYVKNRFTKKTKSGHTITDLVLTFATSVCIDKEKKLYRQDTVKAFIIGDKHPNLPIATQSILITEATLRVNTWEDAETKKPRSSPEILINKWDLV
jgi:hypothetical protein